MRVGLGWAGVVAAEVSSNPERYSDLTIFWSWWAVTATATASGGRSAPGIPVVAGTAVRPGTFVILLGIALQGHDDWDSWTQTSGYRCREVGAPCSESRMDR